MVANLLNIRASIEAPYMLRGAYIILYETLKEIVKVWVHSKGGDWRHCAGDIFRDWGHVA